MVRLELLCRGVVQGVGFRPRVWQLATELELAGRLANVAGGVALDLQGQRAALQTFLERLPRELPAAARLEALEPRWHAPRRPAPVGLRISADPPRPLGIGLIAPALAADRAPCPACRAELLDPTNRRHGDPFISCSACGPRYSIATAEPFARAHTTLAAFRLCPACQAEFEDPADRRFHAETIGCPACGPRLQLLDPAGTPLVADGSARPLAAAVALLRQGAILALQGVGGFQLLANAADGAAVTRLRSRKRRPHKPFALLIADASQLEGLAVAGAAERAALADPAAPIVLLDCPDGAHEQILPGVAPGAPGLGVMLPASPLHLLLARAFAGPLVPTSGNRSGEPLCTDPAEALERLAGMADGFLVHDRPIARPLDDSVLQLIDGRPALLRRARGHAPEPLPLAASGPTVLALGGDLKSAPALALGDRLWLAPHLGDLADARSQRHWRQGVGELLERHGSSLAAIAVDRHPEYVNRQLAPGLVAASSSAPLREVGHHLAHGLAVAVEHGLLNDALLVVALDGLGYGQGPVPLWGCEVLQLAAGAAAATATRLASLRPFPLPGGERAMREPRRCALGLLAASGQLRHPGAAAVDRAFAAADRQLLEQAIAGGCNSPLCSSAGRLVDGVAALLGLVALASHEAHAGLALQAAAARAPAGAGAYPLPDLDWRPLLAALLADIAAGRPAELCAARFHNGLVTGLVESAATAAAATAAVAGRQAETVVLAGGCLQNRLLLEGLIRGLRQRGLRPFWSERLPTNDGGLAAGQIAALLRG
ncbi:MAG: carbamoyltransferase HypF [Synechococcaceae cyanobacterium]